MFKFLMPLLLLASSALADEAMCLSLCEPCKDSKDETCAKIFETCKCEELFGKAEAEAAAKVARSEARRTALGDALYQGCAAGKCVTKIEFEGPNLKTFQASSSADYTPSAEPEVKPLDGDCAELCQVTATGDPGNPMVAKIEESCGCRAHAQDSLKLVEFRLARLEGANSAADSVVKACEGAETCKVQVALNGTTFEVARLEFPQAKQPDPNELALAAFKAKRRAAIGNSLYTNCELGRCQIQLKFDGESGKLQAVKPEGLAPVPEPKVKPLGTECAELCRDLPGEEETPMSRKIEASCGCQAHVQDSIKLEAFRAERIANSNAAADSVVEFCSAKKLCSVELLLDGTSFELKAMKEFEAPPPPKPKYDRQEVALETILSECKGAKANTTCDIRFTFQGTLLSFKKADNPAPAQDAPVNPDQLRKPNAVQAAKAVNDFCSAEKACDVDVSLRGKTLGLISLSPHKGDFPYKEEKSKEEPKKEEKKDKIFYKGISLYGGMFSGKYDDYNSFGFSWHNDGMNFGLGFLLRWYFYKWGSFQTGLNVSYTYVDLGEDYSSYSRYYRSIIDYWVSGDCGLQFHDISAEIPLQLRLGMPALYATFLFNIKKPIWNYTKVYLDGYYRSDISYRYLDEEDTENVFRGINVWSFAGYFGGGFSFTRHVSLEALFGLFEVNTVDEYLVEEMIAEEALTWRVKLDIAW